MGVRDCRDCISPMHRVLKWKMHISGIWHYNVSENDVMLLLSVVFQTRFVSDYNILFGGEKMKVEDLKTLSQNISLEII